MIRRVFIDATYEFYLGATYEFYLDADGDLVMRSGEAGERIIVTKNNVYDFQMFLHDEWINHSPDAAGVNNG